MRAFARVHAQVPQCKLVMVGDGPERETLQKLAIELGISDHLLMPGYLPHRSVFTAYAAADVIAFPSKTETQGLSLLEGLALGKPAVCINELGVKHILTQGGFLTEDNLDEYVDRLVLLLTQPDIYQQKQAEAIQRGQDFSASEMAKRAIEVYSQLIGGVS